VLAAAFRFSIQEKRDAARKGSRRHDLATIDHRHDRSEHSVVSAMNSRE